MARIALIGAGRMGHRFSQAIRRAGHDLVMIFDPDAQPFAIQAEPALALLHTTDFDRVLAIDANIFVICTTANHHIPIALALIAAGHKRLIVEKPLSQSADDAERLRAEARQQGARVIVNHGRRYCPNTAALKALDGSAAAGALRSVAIRMGGGALGCVGTHWIDLCNNLLGGVPDRIYAEISDAAPANNRGAQFDDPGGIVLMHYPGGKRATLDMGDDVGIVVGADFIFERGLVTWHSESAAWAYRHRRLEDTEKPLALYGLPLVTAPFPMAPPDLIAYAMATINDAQADGPIISGLDEACATMEVYSAIRASGRDGTPVRLPLSQADKTIRYAIP